MPSSQLPHLLFYGPPGTGKTSTALAIAKQLYGPELFKSRVLELNASDERGISVVRTKIKDFASVACSGTAPGYPSPPYKLLILDEADAMTEDAQNALRRTLEQHSRVTRFCFICNYVSRIIDPIVSRCAKFRFKLLGNEAMLSRLAHIAQCERVTLGGGTLAALATCSGGDMRKAVTLLQSAAALYSRAQGAITPAHVADVAGVIPAESVAALLAACRGGSFPAAQSAIDSLVKEGYPALQVLTQLSDALIADDSVSDAAKAAVSARLAAADKRLADGADEGLALLDCAAACQRALQGLPPAGQHLDTY